MVHYIDTLVTHAHEEIYSQPLFYLSILRKSGNSGYARRILSRSGRNGQDVLHFCVDYYRDHGFCGCTDLREKGNTLDKGSTCIRFPLNHHNSPEK